MEINIPFSERKLDSELASEDLKYRAILSRDSLFYGFFDNENRIIHDGVISVDLIPKSSILKKNKCEFQSSRIAFNNPIFTLNRNDDGDSLDDLGILTFTHSLGDRDQYVSGNEQLRCTDKSSFIFAVPKAIFKSVTRHVKQCEINHYHSVFLNSLDTEEDKNNIFISLVGGNMNIAYFSNKQFRISNCYQVRNESDFYYYIALIFDQFNLSKGDVTIELDGNLSEIKFDKERFSLLFGTEPRIPSANGSSGETNSMTQSLIRLNECAS